MLSGWGEGRIKSYELEILGGVGSKGSLGEVLAKIPGLYEVPKLRNLNFFVAQCAFWGGVAGWEAKGLWA